jgi:hypothetical protein
MTRACPLQVAFCQKGDIDAPTQPKTSRDDANLVTVDTGGEFPGTFAEERGLSATMVRL